MIMFWNTFSNTFKGPEPDFDIDSFNFFCKKYNVNLPTIDAELANSLKQPINKHSINSAISNLKNSSAGGPDGISSLLLKDLNKKLPHVVQNAFVYEINEGNLDINRLKYRDIILIDKKNDKKDIKKLRPISLTNIFYKVVTNALSFRIKYVIKQANLIPDNITAYRSGKSPLNSVRHCLNAIDICKTLQQQAILINSDISSAYDRVNKKIHTAYTESSWISKYSLWSTWKNNFQ